jgi:hypothetical protein
MIDEQEDQPAEKRTIINEEVDPFEAGWETLLAFRSKYRYRVFFENDIGFKNGVQLDLLRCWLEDNCGIEGEDWELRQSDFPMEELWNRSQDCDERRLYGNNVYLTDISWLVSERLLSDPMDMTRIDEQKYTAGKITVIQTRK